MLSNIRFPRIAGFAAIAAAMALAMIGAATAQAGGGLSTNSPTTVKGSKAKLVGGKAVAPAGAPEEVQLSPRPTRSATSPTVGRWSRRLERQGLRLLRRRQLRPPRRQAAQGSARFDRPLALRRSRQGFVDHGLRQPQPRLHGRRGTPLRYGRDQGGWSQAGARTCGPRPASSKSVTRRASRALPVQNH